MSHPSSDALRIRLLSVDDRAALAALPKRISPESAISRFHGGVTMLTDRTLDQLLDIEIGRHEAVIAVDDRGIAGVARYVRDEFDPTAAEVAILIADEWQHHGVARQLMRPLMTRARDAGIKEFRAEILPENKTARLFFAGLAPTTRERMTGGNAVITVELDDALSGL
jgi:GNAT superfamily N-acetyltransferase